MNMLSRLCALAAVAVSVLGFATPSLAQFQTQGATIFPPTYMGGSKEEDLKFLRDRADEVEKSQVPKSEFAIANELNRAENELSAYTAQSQFVGVFKDVESNFDALASKLKSQKDLLRSFDCEKKGADYTDARAAYFRAIDNLRIYVQYYYADFQKLTDIPSKSCADVRKQLSTAEFDRQAAEVIAAARKSVVDAKAAAIERSDAIEKLIGALKQWRTKLREALNSKVPRQQISEKLPEILTILGCASIGAILIVRLFAKDIQMEWVASGQVIQFVTVMILLSVITALGISNILQENTLGTLLGGIAGYVLAQGVGRAAARDAVKAKSG